MRMNATGKVRCVIWSGWLIFFPHVGDIYKSSVSTPWLEKFLRDAPNTYAILAENMPRWHARCSTIASRGSRDLKHDSPRPLYHWSRLPVRLLAPFERLACINEFGRSRCRPRSLYFVLIEPWQRSRHCCCWRGCCERLWQLPAAGRGGWFCRFIEHQWFSNQLTPLFFRAPAA